MPVITFVLIVLAALCTFVIAAVVVGRAHRLDSVAPVGLHHRRGRRVRCQYLPADTQSRLTPDELEQLLTFHMRWLHAKGCAGERRSPPRHHDTRRRQRGHVDRLLAGEAERNGIVILDDVDVVRRRCPPDASSGASAPSDHPTDPDVPSPDELPPG
jgi:hypothetical protein